MTILVIIYYLTLLFKDMFQKLYIHSTNDFLFGNLEFFSVYNVAGWEYSSEESRGNSALNIYFSWDKERNKSEICNMSDGDEF